jgi:shikimate kinase
MNPLLHVVIAGPMGVGKTTVGTIVADQLGWAFVDSDRVIEALYGKTGRGIATDGGVDKLHRIEAEVFDEALSFAPPSVIAPAASVADHAMLIDRLHAPGVVVALLDCDPGALAERSVRARHRRDIGDRAAESLMTTRRSALMPVARLTIDVTSLSPEGAATRIVELVADE